MFRIPAEKRRQQQYSDKAEIPVCCSESENICSISIQLALFVVVWWLASPKRALFTYYEIGKKIKQNRKNRVILHRYTTLPFSIQ